MADNHRYNGNSRYGGGGGGGRKRRFQDYDNDQGNTGERGYDRRYAQPRQQRRRPDPPGTRLRNKLLSFLDSSVSNPSQELSDIASLVVQYAHDDYVRDTFVDNVASLALEQPAKTVFLAELVRSVNGEKPELVGELVRKLGATVEREIKRGRWREVKLGLRLLASLQDLLEGSGVLPLLETLFQRVVELQSGNPEETLGLELTKIILLTIPYLMATPEATAYADKVGEVLQETDVIASTPHALESMVEPYLLDEDGGKPMACPSLLSILQKQLQNEAENGWPMSIIPRVKIGPLNTNGKSNGNAHGNGDVEADVADTNGDAQMAEESTKHPLPAIDIPEVLNPGQRALYPEIYWSVFAEHEIESVPRTSDIASVLIRDVIVDTINTVDYNRMFVSKFVVELDNFWSPTTFVKRATPFDRLREIPEGKTTWKPEDMVIDAIFAELMQLPAPTHKVVLYHSIIMEICKQAPKAIAPSLGRAIRFVYKTLPALDLELVQRFTDWFAHHVSNFEWRWKWSEWTPDLELSDLAPKKAFIRAVIDKEIRLCFAKRISDSLPPDFAALIVKGVFHDEPDFKFNDSSVPYSSQGQALLALLKDKTSSDTDIQTVLDGVRDQAAADGLDGHVAAADVLVTSICHLGAKSLSHILSGIERNRDRLLAIGPQSEAARLQIITSVAAYWRHHPGQAVNIIDKLLNYTIVTPASVVTWVFAGGDAAAAGTTTDPRRLARHDLLEMAWSTMGKVARRVADIAAARANPELLAAGGDATQLGLIEPTLVRERQGMRDLFAAIERSVAPVAASGGPGEQADDVAMAGGEGGSSDAEHLRQWGAKWLRTWRRRSAVEEARSGELGVESLVGVLAAAAEVDAEVAQQESEDKRRRDEAIAARRARQQAQRREDEEAYDKRREEAGGGDAGDGEGDDERARRDEGREAEADGDEVL